MDTMEDAMDTEDTMDTAGGDPMDTEEDATTAEGVTVPPSSGGGGDVSDDAPGGRGDISDEDGAPIVSRRRRARRLPSDDGDLSDTPSGGDISDAKTVAPGDRDISDAPSEGYISDLSLSQTTLPSSGYVSDLSLSQTTIPSGEDNSDVLSACETVPPGGGDIYDMSVGQTVTASGGDIYDIMSVSPACVDISEMSVGQTVTASGGDIYDIMSVSPARPPSCEDISEMSVGQTVTASGGDIYDIMSVSPEMPPGCGDISDMPAGQTVTPSDRDISDLKTVPPSGSDGDIPDIKTVPPSDKDISDIKTVPPSDKDISDIKSVAPSNGDVSDIKTVAPSDKDISDIKTVPPSISSGDVSDIKTVPPSDKDISDIKTVPPSDKDISDIKTVPPSGSSGDVSDIKTVPPSGEDVSDNMSVGQTVTASGEDIADISLSSTVPLSNGDIDDISLSSTVPLSNGDIDDIDDISVSSTVPLSNGDIDDISVSSTVPLSNGDIDDISVSSTVPLSNGDISDMSVGQTVIVSAEDISDMSVGQTVTVSGEDIYDMSVGETVTVSGGDIADITSVSPTVPPHGGKIADIKKVPPRRRDIYDMSVGQTVPPSGGKTADMKTVPPSDGDIPDNVSDCPTVQPGDGDISDLMSVFQTVLPNGDISDILSVCQTEEIVTNGTNTVSGSITDISDDSDYFDDGDENFDDPEFEIISEPIDKDLWMREMYLGAEEEYIGGFDSEWKTEGYHYNTTAKFLRKPGVKVPLPENVTPLQTFDKIFTEELWQFMCDKTNTHFKEWDTETSNKPVSKSQRWSNVTPKEMKTFIGLCIAMGLLHIPVRRDYWRLKKDLFRTSFPKHMSRDRFIAIWRFLKLEDKHAKVDRTDKMWRMRWFMNYLMTRYQALYEVDGNVSVDESMVKFKGRLSFRQYLPNKPIKWGVKVWVMAESTTGYCTSFQVYTGREESLEESKGLAHRVVMDLARPYFGSHVSIYMDNYYTGVELLEDMKLKGLNACGTVRANRRGIPTNELMIQGSPLERHEYRVAQKDDLTFCIWQDTKLVMVLSNHHNPTATGTVNRRPEGYKQRELKKKKGEYKKVEGFESWKQAQVVVPACLADYQKHMKGVDLLDQMVGYYGFQHRSRKWWRRVFFFLLGVSTHNAYVAMRSQGGQAFKNKYRGYKNWLEDLAEDLITPSVTRSYPMTPPPPPSPASPAGPLGAAAPPRHDFGKIFVKRRLCRECQMLPELERAGGPTIYGCRQCDQPLHMECFGKHYRRSWYWPIDKRCPIIRKAEPGTSVVRRLQAEFDSPDKKKIILTNCSPATLARLKSLSKTPSTPSLKSVASSSPSESLPPPSPGSDRTYSTPPSPSAYSTPPSPSTSVRPSPSTTPNPPSKSLVPPSPGSYPTFSAPSSPSNSVRPSPSTTPNPTSESVAPPSPGSHTTFPRTSVLHSTPSTAQNSTHASNPPSESLAPAASPASQPPGSPGSILSWPPSPPFPSRAGRVAQHRPHYQPHLVSRPSSPSTSVRPSPSTSPTPTTESPGSRPTVPTSSPSVLHSTPSTAPNSLHASNAPSGSLAPASPGSRPTSPTSSSMSELDSIHNYSLPETENPERAATPGPQLYFPMSPRSLTAFNTIHSYSVQVDADFLSPSVIGLPTPDSQPAPRESKGTRSKSTPKKFQRTPVAPDNVSISCGYSLTHGTHPSLSPISSSFLPSVLHLTPTHPYKRAPNPSSESVSKPASRSKGTRSKRAPKKVKPTSALADNVSVRSGSTGHGSHRSMASSSVRPTPSSTPYSSRAPDSPYSSRAPNSPYSSRAPDSPYSTHHQPRHQSHLISTCGSPAPSTMPRPSPPTTPYSSRAPSSPYESLAPPSPVSVLSWPPSPEFPTRAGRVAHHQSHESQASPSPRSHPTFPTSSWTSPYYSHAPKPPSESLAPPSPRSHRTFSTCPSPSPLMRPSPSTTPYSYHAPNPPSPSVRPSPSTTPYSYHAPNPPAPSVRPSPSTTPYSYHTPNPPSESLAPPSARSHPTFPTYINPSRSQWPDYAPATTSVLYATPSTTQYYSQAQNPQAEPLPLPSASSRYTYPSWTSVLQSQCYAPAQTPSSESLAPPPSPGSHGAAAHSWSSSPECPSSAGRVARGGTARRSRKRWKGDACPDAPGSSWTPGRHSTPSPTQYYSPAQNPPSESLAPPSPRSHPTFPTYDNSSKLQMASRKYDVFEFDGGNTAQRKLKMASCPPASPAHSTSSWTAGRPLTPSTTPYYAHPSNPPSDPLPPHSPRSHPTFPTYINASKLQWTSCSPATPPAHSTSSSSPTSVRSSAPSTAPYYSHASNPPSESPGSHRTFPTSSSRPTSVRPSPSTTPSTTPYSSHAPNTPLEDLEPPSPGSPPTFHVLLPASVFVDDYDDDDSRASSTPRFS